MLETLQQDVVIVLPTKNLRVSIFKALREGMLITTVKINYSINFL
jgi:hypothetical protein